MFNNPEWATEQEWDAYACFGFAMQEAQMIEFMFLVMLVALEAKKINTNPEETGWDSLYNDFGWYNLRKLFERIRKHISLPIDFENDLQRVVDMRNELAHGFYWPKNPNFKDKTAFEAQQELKDAASLFSNFAPRVETVMMSLIDTISVKRSDLEAKTKELVKGNKKG